MATQSQPRRMHLRQTWQRRLSGYSHGSLAVANDRLLTVVGGERLECYSFDGNLLWSRRVDTMMPRLPTAGGSVYVDEQTLQRIEIATGRVLAWRDLEPEYPHVSLSDDLLLFPADMPTRLFAVDLDTLATRVEVETEDTSHLHHGMLCESHLDGDVRLRDPATGRELWRWQLPTTAGEHAWHFHYEHLYCRMSGVERLALDVRSGEIQWRHIEGDPQIQRGPSVHQFYKLIGTTAFAGPQGLSAYDVLTGALKWRVPVNVGGQPSFDGTLVALDTTRGVQVIDWSTGQVVARHDVPRMSNDLELSGSRIFIKRFTEDEDAHELCAFELIEGDAGMDEAE